MPTVNADAALSGGAYLRMTVTEGTQDVAANTSEDSWSLTLYKGSFSSFNLGGVGYSASVNGAVVSSGSYTFDFRSTTSKLIASGTVTVTHNADGTKTTGFSGYTDATATSSGGPATASGNLVQTTIPRATVPTLSNSSRQIGQATTITLPRASSSFTHDITYSFGSLTGQTSGLSASSGVATSATFTVPNALVSEMVGQSSRNLTFTVVTKDGGGTSIGSKTVQLVVTPAGGTVYQRPTVTVGVQRALSDGTPDDAGVCAKVSIVAAVTSVLVSTEQNTLTWKTEVSANNGSSWQQLGTGTVSSHGLTLSSASTYTDSDPGTGGTQQFSTTAGYLFRVTITDAYSSAAVQNVGMTTALALFDVYDGDGDSDAVGISVGALFNPSLDSRIQVGGQALVDVIPASTSARGTAEIATEAEARSGDSSRFVTGSTLLAVVGTFKIVPASVGADASIQSNGDVVFTTCSDVRLNGIFSSGFRRYRIHMSVESLSAAATIYARLRNSSTTDSATNYQYQRNYGSASTSTTVTSSGQTQWELTALSATTGHEIDLTLRDPFESAVTMILGQAASYSSGGTSVANAFGGINTGTVSRDGMSIRPSSGNITGRLSVYGMN